MLMTTLTLALSTALLIVLGPSAAPSPQAPVPAGQRATTLAMPAPAARVERWAWPVLPRPPVLRRFVPPPRPWLAGHRGVDLGASPGATIHAPADGRVAFAGVIAGRPVLSVDHAGGLRSTYEPVVASRGVGTPVLTGESVGVISREASRLSHCAPASCLHWGVRRGEVYLDPLALVGGASPVLLPLS